MWQTKFASRSSVSKVFAMDEYGGGAEGLSPEGDQTELEALVESAPGEREEESPMPRASLSLVRAGAETGDVFAFVGAAVIGRFDPSVGPIDVDLGGIDEGVYVSRRHARIAYQDGAWIIEDLGSSNGTFVLKGDDFRRIEEPTHIEDGATVVFGNARFLFRTEPGEPAMESGEE